MAKVNIVAGDTDEAEQSFQEALALKRDELGAESPEFALFQSYYNALTGRTDEALVWLETTFERGFSNIREILEARHDELRSVANDPRYAATVADAARRLKTECS